MSNKSVVIIDTPDVCADCPFRVKDELMYIGDYIYKQLYCCRIMPEDICGEDDEDLDPYIDPLSKPDWCPLKPYKEE